MQTHPNEKIHHNFPDQTQETQVVDLLCIHDSPLVRGLYLSAGFTALLMGILGAVLPVLPTTPFILLAAFCFARSSARFHNKLLANRFAGPIIFEWCKYRSIPRQAKRWAYLLMALSFCSSILLVPAIWQKVMLAVIGVILAIFIWRVPVRDSKDASI
jgi:uncharacterized protein